MAILLARGIQIGLFGGVQGFYTGGEVADIQDQVVDVGQIVVDEVGHLGFGLHDAGVRVDEQWAGERVLVALSRLFVVLRFFQSVLHAHGSRNALWVFDWYREFC